MNIEPLADHKHLIPEIAELHQSEWEHLNPAVTIEKRIASINRAATPQGIPSIFIALEDSEFCGSAALVQQDLETHPELSPWLAAVYVKENWRKQGIATSLVQHCEREAQLAGIKKLYLYTEFATQLYASLGWKVLERLTHRGIEIDLMCKDFGS
ncbi:GNAT family N-acetyltransferase [Pseudoteredinibacter isoporae]|uniref:N-acetylglutamate synthase-like GNAT family acetyltransferase n=1 Tax=Pseudoteredinibacter isoporae TaxID=570281 RepID=A0A7X0JRZ6_9GAMM|nr:GNAT family N-acetyltransferase [Pseudoteredinibacter isoporae]MBB6521218.1 N-acetylglutamate synthase-like GNAT family acetyltransferase [Pseudoteredinibacter isoporae]NHO86777.1 GNAT family N-acetyltransferase [Pseudoteredinibacter isoporae]NIB24771.1 GNAT family N-acetyltransferase [Pseudoteredinibacter isoporae]